MDYYFRGWSVNAIGARWLRWRRPDAGSCGSEGHADTGTSDCDANAVATWGNPGSNRDSYAEAGSS